MNNEAWPPAPAVEPPRRGAVGGRAVPLLHLLLSLAPLLWVALFYLHAWRGKVELGHWPVAFGDGPFPGDRHDNPNYMPDTDALYNGTDLPAFLGLIGTPMVFLVWLACIPAWRLMPPRRRWLHGALFCLGMAAWLVVVIVDPGHRAQWMID